MNPQTSPSTRSPIAWMAGNSVAANLVMLVCLVGGFFALRHMKQEVFPDIEIDVVQVSVAYPGATPEDVEEGIILAIEDAVQDLEGVKEITSVAREGMGIVSIELLEGADGEKLAQDVKSEVDRIVSFPEDAEEPEVRLVAHRRGVLTVVLYGDADKVVLHELAEQVRDRLIQDPDITQVDVEGLPPLEIGIEVSQETLRRYGLTLEEVATRVRKASVDLPGGQLKTSSGDILVRVRERRDYGRQFARLPIITTADGSQVLLGDIATIKDAFEETDRYTTYNGKPAVLLEVYRVGRQTPIQVANAVRRQLETISYTLPPGIECAIFHDASEIYRQRVELLLRNGLTGLVLVLILLAVFLEARLAFWVMLGIPVSFLGSFLFLPAAGVTLNMISLFAYIIAVGIVVDDAIVVGENTYHYHQRGLPFLEAAIRGAREVAMPVTFSILTNIATFMPLYFVPGVMGKIFRMIPIVVSIVFLISLGESLFVLPAHLGHQHDRQRRGLAAWLHARQQAFGSGFLRWVHTRYGPFLAFALRHRYVTLCIGLSVLSVTLSYALSGRMGWGLFPTVESDFSQASIVLPYGSSVRKTEALVRRVLEGAQEVIAECGRPELAKAIICDVGMSGSHTARVRVELAEAEVRNKIMSTEEFTRRWREAVGPVPGVKSLIFASDIGGPGSHSRPIAVELSHRSIRVLEQASKKLARALTAYPRVKDVDDGFQPGKQQLDFTIKPEGKSLGLTAWEVARQIRSAFYGAEVLRQQRGRNEIKIMVRLPERERFTEQTINDLMIRTPVGTYVPLREVAAAHRGRSDTTINRRNGRRVVQVSADIVPRSKAIEVLDDLKTSVLPKLMHDYPGLSYSFEGHQAEMRDSIASLKFTSTLALMAIYAMLAIPFRSFIQPLIVMMSIPFGVVGAFLGHLIMGYDLCIPSLFGIVALSGVVVNDSLVMIDFANRRRRELGMPQNESIHSAAIQRFRPILLTTLTTFGGLAPMIFETSRQARFLIPMALSLGFGLLFATFITLVLIPCLYLIVEDAREMAGRWRLATESRAAEALRPAAREVPSEAMPDPGSE